MPRSTATAARVAATFSSAGTTRPGSRDSSTRRPSARFRGSSSGWRRTGAVPTTAISRSCCRWGLFPASSDHAILTGEFAAVGVTTLLESIREVDPAIRFYQASSSEIFGEPVETPQSEATPLAPLTPYGVAKAYGHFITRSYRSRYGLHASSGILHNHDSPRRPLAFPPRKGAHGAPPIPRGRE